MMNNLAELLESFSIAEIEEYISNLKCRQLRKALIAIKVYKDDLDVFNLNSQIELNTILKNNGI